MPAEESLWTRAKLNIIDATSQAQLYAIILFKIGIPLIFRHQTLTKNINLK